MNARSSLVKLLILTSAVRRVAVHQQWLSAS